MLCDRLARFDFQFVLEQLFIKGVYILGMIARIIVQMKITATILLSPRIESRVDVQYFVIKLAITGRPMDRFTDVINSLL